MVPGKVSGSGCSPRKYLYNWCLQMVENTIVTLKSSGLIQQNSYNFQLLETRLLKFVTNSLRYRRNKYYESAIHINYTYQ